MKKMLIKIFVMFCFLYLIAGCIMPRYKESYMAAFVDKYNYAQSIDTPKIVLVGDSNCAFGIDSEMLEKELNMPVVNMGLHGGVGDTFLMDCTKPIIKKGDIVIMAWAGYERGVGITDGPLAWMVLEDNAELWKYVNTKDYKVLYDSFPIYLKKCINIWRRDYKVQGTAPAPYNRRSFNLYGDIDTVGTENIMDGGYVDTVPYPTAINYEHIRYMNDYVSYIEQKGAVAVVAFSPIIMFDGQTSLDELNEHKKQLVEALNCSVISNFEDYLYPTDYFYDTNYHLNDMGKVYRTRQLIKDIQMWETARLEDNNN